MSERLKRLNSSSALMIIGTLFIVMAGVFMVLFFLRGETKYENGGVVISSDSSLICKRSGVQYPFFDFDGSTSKDTSIYVVFNTSGSSVSSISLRYTLHYANDTLVRKSEAYNHASMNTFFASNGLASDSLGLNFSMQADKLIMSLFTNGNYIDSNSKKFFLIDDGIGLDMKSLEKHYLSSNFDCNIQDNNN